MRTATLTGYIIGTLFGALGASWCTYLLTRNHVLENDKACNTVCAQCICDDDDPYDCPATPTMSEYCLDAVIELSGDFLDTINELRASCQPQTEVKQLGCLICGPTGSCVQVEDCCFEESDCPEPDKMVCVRSAMEGLGKCVKHACREDNTCCQSNRDCQTEEDPWGSCQLGFGKPSIGYCIGHLESKHPSSKHTPVHPGDGILRPQEDGKWDHQP